MLGATAVAVDTGIATAGASDVEATVIDVTGTVVDVAAAGAEVRGATELVARRGLVVGLTFRTTFVVVFFFLADAV
jgi:hypothetical protein